MLKLQLAGLKIKYIIVFYCLGLAMVIWVFGLFLYLPQTVRHSELRAELQAKRQQIKTIENFALAHPEADKYLVQLDQRIASLDRMLPDNPDLSAFVVQLERAAKETGVQISQLKPAAAVAKEGYREIPVEILMKGSFFEITNFLKKLEDGPRFSSVQNLSLQSKQDFIESKLNILIYSSGGSAAAQTLQPVQGKGDKQ